MKIWLTQGVIFECEYYCYTLLNVKYNQNYKWQTIMSLAFDNRQISDKIKLIH